MRSLVVCVALALAPSPAGAHPWRFETGLPDPPAPGAPEAEATPGSPTGLAHPFARFGDFRLGVLGDAFITFRFDHRQDQWNNEFELSRLQLSAWSSYKSLVAVNVTLESIRSSSSTSYFGIDGDSLLPRFKYAFVEITPYHHWISLRAGIVPDLLVPRVEASWDFRVQGAVGPERDNFFSPGDLGATLEAALPAGLGSLAVAYTNGEGIHLREQNNGKNTTVALRITPGRFRLPGLAIQLLYRDGSVGADSASDSRLAGGVTYTGARLGAGALAMWAIGYLGAGGRDAVGATAWVRGELPRRFQLFGRCDLLWPDAHTADSTQVRAIAGVAYALPAIARLVASWEGTFPTGGLSAAVPAISEHQILLQVEARL